MKILFIVCTVLAIGFGIAYYVVKQNGVFSKVFDDWRKYGLIVLRVVMILEIILNVIGSIVGLSYILLLYVFV